MKKQETIRKYEKDEEKLVIAKAIDKLVYCKKNNKIASTDFLDEHQLKIIKTTLQLQQEKRYLILGGIQEAQRNKIIFYPEKMEDILRKKTDFVNKIIKIIKIDLPNELKGKYEHRDYLGALMKMGIKREKIGDILVDENGADIIVEVEMAEYIKISLEQLKRFSKSKIEIRNIEDIRKDTIEKEKITVIVPSLRIDAVVSEVAKVSRSKAEELISLSKVLVNYEICDKGSKLLKNKDILTIRGKGKYEVGEIISNTKKGKNILQIEQYK